MSLDPSKDSQARRCKDAANASAEQRRGCSSRAIIAVIGHVDAREAPAQRAVTIKATSEF